MDRLDRIDKIESVVAKFATVFIGAIIAVTTYLIQTKIAEMSDSMKAIEKTTNAIQVQQMGFQKDVEYLRLEQQTLSDRIKRLEK